MLPSDMFIMLHRVETYRKMEKETGQQQPFIKAASAINAAEVVACAEMGCQGVSRRSVSLRARPPCCANWSF